MLSTVFLALLIASCSQSAPLQEQGEQEPTTAPSTTTTTTRDSTEWDWSSIPPITDGEYYEDYVTLATVLVKV